MIRGTTPTHRFKLPFAAGEVRALCVAYAQRGEVVLRRSLADVRYEGNELTVTLTQSDTLRFTASAPVSLQVRLLTHGGMAYASRILVLDVADCLCEEVLS